MPINPKIIHPIRSDHITSYKLVTSVLFGLMAFAGSFLSVPLLYGIFPLSIVWSMVFLMIVTLAWGTKYGLLAFLFGGAWLYPFFLSPQLGLVGIVQSLSLFGWLFIHGYGAKRRWLGNAHALFYNMYVLQIFYVLVRFLLFLILAPILFRLNPIFWGADALSSFSFEYLILFSMKGLLIETPLLAVGSTLLLLPLLRRMLLLSRKESSRYNTRIILSSWLFGLAFSASILYFQNYLQTSSTSIAWLLAPNDKLTVTATLMSFLFILAGGVISSYMERLIDTQDALVKSELDLRNALFDVRELNIHLQEKVDERTARLESAVAELEDFAQTVSSDLRQPVEEICQTSARILERLPPVEKSRIRLNLERIHKIASETTLLVEKLLEYSSTSNQSFLLERIDLQSLLSETVEKFRIGGATKPIQLDFLQPLPEVWGDPMLISQAMLNIISNAVKFSSTRAKTRIEIGWLDLSEEQLFFIRDNGIGFDMQHAEQLFGVFKRLHRKEEYEGCGIGLATIRKIIHRHGGEVWMESAPDQGASVFFTLPKKETSNLGDNPLL